MSRSERAGSSRGAARSLGPAAALAALGLLLVAVAGTMHWLTAVPGQPVIPGASRVPLKGSALVPAALPLALMATAGLVAAAAAGPMLRGILRGVAALLTVVAAVGLVVLVVRVTSDPAPTVARVESARQSAATGVAERTLAPVLSLVGGLALTATGGIALVFRRRWPGLAVRYERDPASPAAQKPAATAWDALDRGDDPTADVELDTSSKSVRRFD
jgi:hypothetical protein